MASELPGGFIVKPAASAQPPVTELPEDFQIQPTAEVTAARGSPTDALMQGVAFGFADEIAGAAAVTADKALGLFGVRPSRPAGEVFEEARARKEQEIQNIPAAVRVPLEAVGGIFTGGGAGKAALTGLSKVPGVSKLPTLAKTALVGGGEGAVIGAGTSQPGERGTGAAIGGATGVVLGITVPLTISGISKAINTSPQLRKLGAAGRQSARRVLEAFKNDDITLDQLQARMNRLGPEAIPADVGAENVKSLAQAVTGTAGKGRRQAGRVLSQRSKQAPRRVVEAIKGVVSGDDAGEVTERLIKERSAAAKPLYDQALAVGVVDDPLINQLATKSRPFKQAIVDARAIDPDLVGLPDNHMVLLDKAYKAVGGKANKARVSGDGDLSNTLNDIRVRFRERLVKLNPVYGDALDTFAGHSSLQDALELGQDVFKPKSGITVKAVEALTDSEREMFKVGLADALVDKVETGVVGEAANSAKRLLRTTKIEKQIKAAFGNDLRAFREFKAAMLKEIEFAQTAGVRFGSRTAPLAEEVGRNTAIDAADALLDATTGNPTRSILSLARKGTQKGIPPELNERLGQELFTPDLTNLRAVEQNALRKAVGQGAALPAVGGANIVVEDFTRKKR